MTTLLVVTAVPASRAALAEADVPVGRVPSGAVAAVVSAVVGCAPDIMSPVLSLTPGAR